MAAPNATLAYRVLDHIDADPDRHDQNVWVERTDCGTVACFAGWVVLLSGDKPVFDEDDPVECETHEVHAKGTIMSVSCRAAHLLGISYDWRSPIGNPLFAPALSRAELGVRVG
jgi:hypothetical protein